MNFIDRFELVIILILFAAILEGTSAWAIKKAYIEQEKKYLLMSFILFVGIIYIFYRLYHLEKISVINSYYSAFSLIIITALGIFLFKEQLSKCEMVGIILVFLGIIMISIDELHFCIL